MRRSLLSFFLGVFCAWSASGAQTNHVVIISMDGFPAYMLNDPIASLPTIRRLALEGASSEGMQVSNPSVTWPNHTTLVTGVHPSKHSVLFNGLLELGGPGQPVRVDPRKDQADLIAVPTLFDQLHQSGLRSAAINWPCTRDSKTLEINFPDVPENLAHTTPALLQELIQLGQLANTDDAAFRSLSGAARDQIWTDAAIRAIHSRRPDLLLLHLLNTDSTHHRYGALSPASYSAVALADMYVRQVVEALVQAGMWNTTSLFITSDHGFLSAEKTVQPNVLLRKKGFLQLSTPFQIVKARAQVIGQGGIGLLYLTDRTSQTAKADYQQLVKLFSEQEGVAAVLDASEFAALGMPVPRDNSRMADLVLVARDGYYISSATAGEEVVTAIPASGNIGYHGALSTHPKMRAAFVAVGRGIKRGVRIPTIENIDVAPTAAHLLGHRLTHADGRVLQEILE